MRAMNRTLCGAAVAAMAFGGANAALGVEVTVQNDSVMPGENATVCPCFAAGEHAAVWLTSPCDGSIVAIQVFWRSLLANQPDKIEDSILIRNAGVYPSPGSVIATLEAPVLTDGVLNEYRFFDENQTIPINIPVVAGQEFVVDFIFFNPNAATAGPSLVFDGDGATPGKNAIFTGIWQSNESLGVTGDWFIRAVIDCDPQGACCTDGVCTIAATELVCISGGGVFQGIGTDCSGDPCPVVTGACCFPDVSCQEGVTQTDCEAMSGVYLGNGTLCEGSPCTALDGACCTPVGGCVLQNQDDCVNQIGGVWQGPGTICPDDCVPTCVGDLDGDFDTDVFDFGDFAAAFGTSMGDPGYNPDADFDNDGDVDVFDFGVFGPDFGCTP